MVTIGIDCGSQYTKTVLMKDGKIICSVKYPTAFDLEQAAKETYEIVLKETGYEKPDAVAATGVGRDSISFSNGSINEVCAAAKGAYFVHPETEMVIDLGAESCRAVCVKENGLVRRYEVNDKCASGAGTFIEAMARALQLDLTEMGGYSLRHEKDISINAQCVVFAESEVVSLIHQQETVEDIAHGILAGIANRVGALARRAGIPQNVILVGGTGNNKGLAACLGKELGREICVPEKPEFVNAIGAACYAATLA